MSKESARIVSALLIRMLNLRNKNESEVKVLVAQSCLDSVTSWIVACQALLSVEFSRHKYWSG